MTYSCHPSGEDSVLRSHSQAVITVMGQARVGETLAIGK
jgi:hypothetical protein